MNMYEWAKKEVEIACKKENPDRKSGEWDYGCAYYESALKAYKSLMEYESALKAYKSLMEDEHKGWLPPAYGKKSYIEYERRKNNE